MTQTLKGSYGKGCSSSKIEPFDGNEAKDITGENPQVCNIKIMFDVLNMYYCTYVKEWT